MKILYLGLYKMNFLKPTIIKISELEILHQLSQLNYRGKSVFRQK